MRAAYEVTFICYSPFSLDIFPRNVQNKPIKFKQFQEKLYHETGVFTLKGTGKLELEDTFRIIQDLMRRFLQLCLGNLQLHKIQ